MKKLSLLLLAGVIIVGCKSKKPNQSEGKTLTNFAKGEDDALIVNHCGIDFDGNASNLPDPVQKVLSQVKAEDDASKRAVLGVLTSVPGLLLDIFFQAGGEVIASSEATDVCRATPFSAAEKEMAGPSGVVASCWRQHSPGEAPKIYLKNDPELIHHSLVRLFGYMYTEFFVARINDPSAPATFQSPEWKDATQAFLQVRSDIASAFLTDVRAAKLPTYDSLNKFSNDDRQRFENYVFAEALDSYYCSDETRADFKKDFAATFGVFTKSDNPNAPATQFGIMEDEG
jgi:hypothetical protein